MSTARNSALSIAIATLLAAGLGACSVSGSENSGTVAPSVNPTGAGSAERVDQTKLPADWPSEASVPEGLSIVSVAQNASGTTVTGTVKSGDPIKMGNDLKSAWEKNGVLISESNDENKLFSMAGISKDGKSQLTATIAKSGDQPVSVILTSAPAA